MAEPLTGLRVLDLSRILAGPLVGQMLGDLGAEVIKVERPGKGDDAREMGPPFLARADGSPTNTAGFFLSCNRNKKSIALDIGTPKGQAIILQLASQCDIIIENFKVGTLKRYGLDYEALKAVNSKLVYCSITGFGQTGPDAPKPGYDGIFQAMGGMMSVSGHPEDVPGAGPMKVGISIIDILTAYNATIAILAAIRHRDSTGKGQFIDMSLLDYGIPAKCPNGGATAAMAASQANLSNVPTVPFLSLWATTTNMNGFARHWGDQIFSPTPGSAQDHSGSQTANL
jgi:crotonobetainyl-CoA:carnitine CoA-transferase CaiB-like acyl-CoA transferase